jgi:hypothetical protein
MNYRLREALELLERYMITHGPRTPEERELAAQTQHFVRENSEPKTKAHKFDEFHICIGCGNSEGWAEKYQVFTCDAEN